MKLFHRMNRLDLAAGTILTVLSLVISAVIAYSNWLGIFVSLQTANPLNEISPYEVLTLKFSQPVQPNDVENQLQLQPSVPGKLNWQDDQTAFFITSVPFQGSLKVHMVPGKIGSDGGWLRRDISWSLTVRPPEIVYINYVEPKRELMAVPANGGAPQQLTSTGGDIYDFSVSTSGDTLAYSVFNDKKGLDLWVVERSGKNPHRLLDCGANRCSSPAWSPDDKTIAYNREPAGITSSSPTGAPRPWLVTVETGAARPVFSDQQVIGYGALWSPDGNWLASYDGVASLIRAVNLQSAQQVTFPSSLGMLGSWSPDSNFLIYPNIITGTDNKIRTYIFKADFKSGELGTLVGKTSNLEDFAYSSPEWSPTGKELVLTMRIDPLKPGRQVWIIDPVTLGGPVIASQPGYTYDFLQWDPWGTGMVIQQTNLTETFKPEVATWYPAQGLKVIAENGMFPLWLP